MYKLIIVEDEFMIRNTLSEALNWNEAGCIVTGTAEGGIQALDLIELDKPDIIISDIKMDGMDGIELCQKVKDIHPEIKVIIITGHGEFDYAQSALKLGVKDLILKPIDHNELMNSVRKAIAEIELEKVKKDEFQRMKKTIEENISALRENFLLELLSNSSMNREEIYDKMSFFSISFEKYYVMALEIDRYDDFLNNNGEMDRQLKRMVIRQDCIKVIDKYSKGYLFEKETKLGMVIQAGEPDIITIAEEIQAAIKKEIDLSVTIGISEPAEGYEDFISAFKQSAHALRHKYYLGDGAIISVSDIVASLVKENIKIQPDYSRIIQCVKVGDCEGALKRFDEVMLELRRNMPQDMNFMLNLAAEIIIAIQTNLFERNIDINSIIPGFNLYSKLSNCNTLPDITEMMSVFIGSVASHIHSKNKTQNSAAVAIAMDHIKKNYYKDVTLNDVSVEVYMNPNYLGRLIKKETGKNFSDILSEIRIEKAKELMKDMQLKTYEISEKVGISDSRYFSQLFRKMTGFTPTEYRNSIK